MQVFPGIIHRALRFTVSKALVRLRQVDKYLIQWYSLFDTLLHKLAGGEELVHSTPPRSKTILAFWDDTRADPLYQSV